MRASDAGRKIIQSGPRSPNFRSLYPGAFNQGCLGHGRGLRLHKAVRTAFYIGQRGNCHVVIVESGLVRPGELFVRADSHTCAAGAFNCPARGAGSVDTLQAMTHKGVISYPVSETVRYEFVGALTPHVSGKDVFSISRRNGGTFESKDGVWLTAARQFANDR